MLLKATRRFTRDTRARGWRARADGGQATAEFGLVVTVLVFMMMGVVDFGRLVAMQAAAVTATREAARYGSAVGTAVGSAEPQYLYCPGIRTAAQQVVAGVLTLTNANTLIWYDDGTGTSAFSDAQACDASPARESASDIDSFDRIVVQVTATYEPISPIRVLVGPITVVSVDRRMIVKTP